MDESNRENQPLEFDIVELEDRLEFGAALIDSDLGADDNSGCNNVFNCGSTNTANCSNGATCHG